MRALLLDTETTGIDEPEAIQVAHLELTTEGPHFLNLTGESFNEYYAPTKEITLGAQAVHHIFADELEGCEPTGSFELPEGTAWLIGHNIDFDWRVLKEPDVKRICTLALARFLLPDLDSHSLSAVAYHFFGKEIRAKLKGAHNAFEDIHINLMVLHALAEEWQHAGHAVVDMHSLWELSERARIPTKWTFGKHKGKRIEEADRGYVTWYRGQPDTDPYLLKALAMHF